VFELGSGMVEREAVFGVQSLGAAIVGVGLIVVAKAGIETGAETSPVRPRRISLIAQVVIGSARAAAGD
jgi:hypothetical protein